MGIELEFSAFSFQYWKGSPKALTDISLTVPAGTVCALLGPTNSGKTTCLHALSGILGSHHREGVATGSIRVGTETYSPLPASVLFPQVGLTIQEPYFQISGLRQTVREEVALTLESLDLPDSEIVRRTDKLLTDLGLEHLAERNPADLSGGEMHRVALATILIARPPVLLLDEPCNSLDGVAQQRLISSIRFMRGDNTILIADCQLDLSFAVADLFVVLDGGKVIFSGRSAQFIEKLPEFVELLPVGSWHRAIKRLRTSPRYDRINKIIGVR